MKVPVTKYRTKTRKTVLLSITLCIIILIMIYNNIISLPVGLSHLFHLYYIPKDLHDPIVLDRISINEKGYSKTYILKPKYFDIYEVGFFIKDDTLPSSYRYDGEMKLEFRHGESLLSENIVHAQRGAYYSGKDMKFDKIILYNFDIPIEGKYKNNISMTLRIIKPDTKLKFCENSIWLYVAVSAIP